MFTVALRPCPVSLSEFPAAPPPAPPAPPVPPLDGSLEPPPPPPPANHLPGDGPGVHNLLE